MKRKTLASQSKLLSYLYSQKCSQCSSKDCLEIFVLMFYLVLKCTAVFHLSAAVQQKRSNIGQCITLHYEDVEFSFKLEPFQKRLPSKSKWQN